MNARTRSKFLNGIGLRMTIVQIVLLLFFRKLRLSLISKKNNDILFIKLQSHYSVTNAVRYMRVIRIFKH